MAGKNVALSTLLVILLIGLVALRYQGNVYRSHLEQKRATSLWTSELINLSTTHEQALVAKSEVYLAGVNRSNWWEQKSKFQQSQVHKYCLQYYGRTHHGRLFETMVLVSKEHKAGLCPVPKAASTTQKILMVHSILRTIPDSYSTVVKGVNYNVLRQEATKLALARLSSVDKLAALNEYFLVFMFRNPFDRLLSAYRSKFSRLQLNRKEFYKEKVWILLHYQPGVYKKWLEAHRSYSVNISFGDFVDFLTTTHQLDNDPHFMSVMSLCNPCKVRFSYYGNFKTFEQDIGVLMNKIQALKGELRVKSPKSFSSHIAQYYRQLNEMQKRRVLEKLSTDLEFYYYIFPAEKTNDEEMLQMKVN